MVRFKVNGTEETYDGDPEMPLLVVLARRGRIYRDKVWLWHGFVRRLHGSQGWRSGAIVLGGDERRERSEHYHDRGHIR